MVATRALLLLVVAWLLVALHGTAWAGPVVATQSGAVEGVINGAAAEWRGVPYAAPPVGEARWRPPAPAAPWSGVRDATTFAPPCAQPDFDSEATVGQEDCLNLNVFAPAGASAGDALPVLVHLHPGSNSFGRPYENASAFVGPTSPRRATRTVRAFRRGRDTTTASLRSSSMTRSP